MIDIPMPIGNPLDERYKELRSALDTARRAVIDANKRDSGATGDEILELRHRAYRAWQELETFLRDQKILSDDTRVTG
jgi:hypothetical protein